MDWITQAYQVAEKARQALIVKLNKEGCKLNKRDIAFISKLTGIAPPREPNRLEAAKLIYMITGDPHQVPTLKKRGNNGGTRQKRAKSGDMALCEAFAAWDGSRADFVDKQAGLERSDTRTIDRALKRGEKHLRDETFRHLFK